MCSPPWSAGVSPQPWLHRVMPDFHRSKAFPGFPKHGVWEMIFCWTFFQLIFVHLGTLHSDILILVGSPLHFCSSQLHIVAAESQDIPGIKAIDTSRGSHGNQGFCDDPIIYPVVNGGSDKRSVWCIHIPNKYSPLNGEAVGTTWSFPTIC